MALQEVFPTTDPSTSTITETTTATATATATTKIITNQQDDTIAVPTKQTRVKFAPQEDNEFSCSEGSWHSSTTIYRNQELRSNLTRTLLDRDPLMYYEIVHVLGVGSMGSVSRVKKRPEVMGGSARSEVLDALRQQQEQQQKQIKNHCFQLPFFPCWWKKIQTPSKDLLQLSSSPSSHRNSSYQINYALKSIHLPHIGDPDFVEELKNEIEILKTLDHPHVVRPMEVYMHRDQLFIVMELCSGGDLYTRDPYTEEDAARIVSSILSAVTFMHAKNVVHRDLKYENIMFVNNSPRSEIKLIDFGLSKRFVTDTQGLTDGVGTIYTMAPEVLKGTYTSQADIWSIGVITYMLLSSQMPFYGRERSDIIEQIMKCNYDFNGRRWKRVSPQAKSFVQDLLVLDPDERLSGDLAFRSTWLNRRFATSVRGPTNDELNLIIETFQHFCGYSRLKKLALMVIAHKSTTEEIGILRKVFERFDIKKKGQLVFEEFKDGLKAYGYSEEELIRLFVGIDLDGTGIIRYTEFLAATIEAHGAIDEGRLAEAFDCLDTDDSGYITVENLAGFLGDQVPREEITKSIQESSHNGDTRISYPEFVALWEDLGDQSLHAPTLSKVGEVNRSDVVINSIHDEANDVASTAYLDVKKFSQRKLEDALKIEVNDALTVIYGGAPPAMSFENNIVVKSAA